MFEVARAARIASPPGEAASMVEATSAPRNDGIVLAARSANGVLLHASLLRGRVTRWLPWSGSPVAAMALSADGEWLLCVSNDNSLALVPILSMLCIDDRIKLNISSTASLTKIGTVVFLAGPIVSVAVFFSKSN